MCGGNFQRSACGSSRWQCQQCVSCDPAMPIGPLSHQPEAMTKAVELINYAFTCIFLLEAAIKVGAPGASATGHQSRPAQGPCLPRQMPTDPALSLQVIGLGWTNYWKMGWNRFDLLLVASSLADMLVSLIGGADVGALKIQKVMRLLRLARVVKLVRSMKVRGGQALVEHQCHVGLGQGVSTAAAVDGTHRQRLKLPTPQQHALLTASIATNHAPHACCAGRPLALRHAHRVASGLLERRRAAWPPVLHLRVHWWVPWSSKVAGATPRPLTRVAFVGQ